MPRATLIAELATNHGGNMVVAEDMIRAAANAGADIVKTQGYQIKHLKPTDPQYEWFKQCELSEKDHLQLMTVAEKCKVQYLSTAYTVADLERLYCLGLTTIKIGSGESRSALPYEAYIRRFRPVYATLPWGSGAVADYKFVYLSTIPLYPAPVEAFSQIKQQVGYSDHHVGIDIAKLAIARGVTLLEKHFHLTGRGRNQAWNMTPDDLRELRRWAEICAQALDGTKYEGRWSQ